MKRNIASPLHRIIAGLIETCIQSALLLWIIHSVVSGPDIKIALGRALSGLIILIGIPTIWSLINNLYLVTHFGGGVGKLMTGIQIVDSRNKFIDLKTAFLRNYVGYMASAPVFGLGFLWVFKDTERRGWHDIIADTYVTVKNQNGLIIGTITLIGLILINGLLLRSAYAQFTTQLPMYQSFAEDFISEPKVRYPFVTPPPTPASKPKVSPKTKVTAPINNTNEYQPATNTSTNAGCSQYKLSDGPAILTVTLNPTSGSVSGDTVIRVIPTGTCPNESAKIEQWISSGQTQWTSPEINPGKYRIEAANGNYQGVVSQTIEMVSGFYSLSIQVNQ